jgi:hypothetical protein
MPGLGDIIVDDINRFSDAVGSWTAILLVICLGAVLLGVRLNIERIHDHNRGRL